MPLTRLLFFLALLLPGLAWPVAQVRNVWVEPAFFCPGSGQTITVHYQASHVGQGLMAFGFISQDSTVQLASDYGFLFDSPGGALGTGPCPSPAKTPGIAGWESAATVDSDPANVTFRDYQAVTCLPAATAGWGTVHLILKVLQAWSWQASSVATADQTLDLAVEVSCSKRRVSNRGGLWYASSNTVDLVIDNSCAVSPSNTPTRTSTPTITPSPSATPSRTTTPTYTSTPSPSSSPTHTPSSSATATLTATPSASPSRTPTSTASETNTPGPSPTYSLTSTQTATSTYTPSSTATPSATPSASATPTYTQTASATPSSTSTLSSTSTATPSATPTSTASSTATPSATASSTVTLTLVVSPSNTPTHTLSSTSTLTYSSTPSSSATPTLSSTPSITYTSTPSPSSTSTPSATLSSTATTTATPTPSSTATPSATLTYSVSPTWTISPTASPTSIPQPFRLTVGLYNAAGERVRLLFEGAAPEQPLDLVLTEALVVSGQTSTTLVLGSQLRLPWQGQNDTGQAVAGGVYYFKAEFADPYGTVTSLVKQVQVVTAPSQVLLEIFNSAGEVVWSRSLGATLTAAVDLVISRSGELAFDYDPVTGAVQESALFTVRDQKGADQVFAWDGLDSRGRPVSSGIYMVQVTSTSPGGRKDVIAKPVSVLGSARDPFGGSAPVLAPNPARGSAEVVVAYPLQSGSWGAALVYNLAGELVGQAMDLNRSGRMNLATRPLASGIYMVEVQQRRGTAVLARRWLRLALVK